MAELGLPFPEVSSDPLEQFLVAEAVMTQYAVERAGELPVDGLGEPVDDAHAQALEQARRFAAGGES